MTCARTCAALQVHRTTFSNSVSLRNLHDAADDDGAEDDADDDCHGVYGGGVPPTSCVTVGGTPSSIC